MGERLNVSGKHGSARSLVPRGSLAAVNLRLARQRWGALKPQSVQNLQTYSQEILAGKPPEMVSRHNGIAHQPKMGTKMRPLTISSAYRPYLTAIEDEFGAEVNFAQLQKIYGAPQENEKRYSPAVCIGCDMKVVTGDPDPKHVSTSYVER